MFSSIDIRTDKKKKKVKPWVRSVAGMNSVRKWRRLFLIEDVHKQMIKEGRDVKR